MLIALGCLALGALVGRYSHATAPEMEPESKPPAKAIAPCLEAPREVVRPSQPKPAPVVIDQRDATACPALATAITTCSQQLASAQLEMKRRDELRLVREGTPLPQPPEAPAPRFTSKAMRDAVALAFTQTKVPGSVQGIDCAEYPCIIFGRIRGAEDQMEKLEEASSLAAYEQDILTVLLWTATDEAAQQGGPLAFLKERPEQSLFAMAFYPRTTDARPAADNLDRRVRSRTADLWNTMSPADETGH